MILSFEEKKKKRKRVDTVNIWYAPNQPGPKKWNVCALVRIDKRKKNPKMVREKNHFVTFENAIEFVLLNYKSLNA